MTSYKDEIENPVEVKYPRLKILIECVFDIDGGIYQILHNALIKGSLNYGL